MECPRAPQSAPRTGAPIRAARRARSRARPYVPVRDHPAVHRGRRSHGADHRTAHRARHLHGVRPGERARRADPSRPRQEHVRRRHRRHLHADAKAPRGNAARARPERSDARHGRALGGRVRPHRGGDRSRRARAGSRRVGRGERGRAHRDGQRHREPRRHRAGRATAGDVHRSRRGSESPASWRQRRRAELLRRAGDHGPRHARHPGDATGGVDGPDRQGRVAVRGRRCGRGRGRHRRLRAHHGSERRGAIPRPRPVGRLRNPARVLRRQLSNGGRVGPAPVRHARPDRPRFHASSYEGPEGLLDRSRTSSRRKTNPGRKRPFGMRSRDARA